MKQTSGSEDEEGSGEALSSQRRPMVRRLQHRRQHLTLLPKGSRAESSRSSTPEEKAVAVLQGRLTGPHIRAAVFLCSADYVRVHLRVCVSSSVPSHRKEIHKQPRWSTLHLPSISSYLSRLHHTPSSLQNPGTLWLH